ncbi:MAG: hypothetical protein WC233_10960 [Sphaerochaeta sp.]
MIEKNERVFSESGEKIIEVVRDSDGSYILHKFVRKYDSEEEKFYEVRELPNPTGKYGNFSSAVKEAKRVLGVL